MDVKLIWLTPDAERQIAYITRVSNFKHQGRKAYKKLLRYCLREGHWSPFEMACMCLEIHTTRAISAQIMRHRSFHFQEFSQRYAAVPSLVTVPARRQDTKNRQNSLDDLDAEIQDWWTTQLSELGEHTVKLYQEALDRGIAKECARFILPLRSYTKLYMQGTLRDWIHYINLRCGHGTQKEHQDIAMRAKQIFIEHFPTIAEACGWQDQSVACLEVGANPEGQNPQLNTTPTLHVPPTSPELGVCEDHTPGSSQVGRTRQQASAFSRTSPFHSSPNVSGPKEHDENHTSKC